MYAVPTFTAEIVYTTEMSNRRRGWAPLIALPLSEKSVRATAADTKRQEFKAPLTPNTPDACDVSYTD